MSANTSLDSRMNLRTVAWPIFVEQSLRMSLMAADTLMLSSYSDSAVAAVGLAGNFSFFLMLLYMIASMGCGILIGQYLGADKPDESKAFAQTGLLLAVLLSIAVGVIAYFGAEYLVRLYQLDQEVENLAYQYTLITGSLSIGVAISIVLSTVLRAYGHSKSPMWIHFLGGFINIIGNYVALFGPFGIPITGVVGVAVSTVVSQFVTAIACFFAIRYLKVPVFNRTLFRYDLQRIKAILKIGLPKAGEGISYNLAQVVIMFFVAKLGTAALAAVTIAHTLARIVFIFSLSLGQASQILSSYLVGKKLTAILKRNVHQYWIIGVITSFVFALIMALNGEFLASVFTSDAETQTLIATLLLVTVFLEPGRAINLIVIMSLQGAGDVVFPVKVGVISMWLVGVLGAYLIGIEWALGVVGIWIAVALDEWVRGLIMIYRWHSDQWTTKAQLG